MTFTYNPKGVCSRQFTIEVEDGVVGNVSIVGGCCGTTPDHIRAIISQKAL